MKSKKAEKNFMDIQDGDADKYIEILDTFLEFVKSEIHYG